MRMKKSLAALLLALPLGAQAWVLPYGKPASAYPMATSGDSATWSTNLNTWWNSWKSTYITSDSSDPTDPTGYTVTKIKGHVSEGVGYAMLFSVLMNDSTTFRKVWFNAERNYWLQQAGSSLGWYSWCKNSNCGYGYKADSSAASDADEDIGLSLIFATALSKMGYWPNYTYIGKHQLHCNASKTTTSVKTTCDDTVLTSTDDTINLEQKALAVVKSFGKYMISKTSGNYPAENYVLPNSAEYATQNASGSNVLILNPSYVAPAWYRVFSDFLDFEGGNSTDWSTVIANSYSLIAAQPGAASGLAADWCLWVSADSCGTIPSPYSTTSKMSYANFGSASSWYGQWMYWDAIRTPWRIGMDGIWNANSDAYAYCKKPWNSSVAGLGSSASDPGLYDSLNTSSPNKLTNYTPSIGPHAMWAVAALAGKLSGDAASKTANAAIGAVVRDEVPTSISSSTKTDHKYFDDALHLMGSLAISGNFPNIWSDLKASFPDTTAQLQSFKANRTSAVMNSDSVTFTATFNKTVNCTLIVRGPTNGAVWKKLNVSGQTVTFSWLAGSKVAGSKAFVAGETAEATLTWAGTATATRSATASVLLCSTSACDDAAIGDRVNDHAYLQRLSNGSVAVHQTWFAGQSSAHITLRNIAGMALYQGSLPVSEGMVKLPTLNLAPGWYAVESQAAGQRAMQTFTISR